jgi:hypothetical protein
MSYAIYDMFCSESAKYLRNINPSVTCDLKTFKVTIYEEVIATEVCKLDPAKVLKWWTSVPTSSEVVEMVFGNVVLNHRVFIVGNWAYLVVTAEVDSFNPEEFSNGDAMFPLNQVEEFVASLSIPSAMSTLFKEVLDGLQKMHPHLARGTEPALDRETLSDPKNGSVYAWANRVSQGYRFGVKGCSGKSFYIVKDSLYTTCSEEFDPNVPSTYESKENFVNDSKWIIDKLKRASTKWLGVTDKRSSNSSSGAYKRPAAPQSRPAPSYPVKADAPSSAWRAPAGPTVDDDGFASVPTKRNGRR